MELFLVGHNSGVYLLKRVSMNADRHKMDQCERVATKTKKSISMIFLAFKRIRRKKIKNSVKNGFRRFLRQRRPGKSYDFNQMI